MASNALPQAPADRRGAVEWAEAVEWAVDSIDQKTMTRKRAGSGLKLLIWQIAHESEANKKELAFKLMPQAMGILDAQSNAPADDMIAKKEQAAVAEMKKFLAAAIREATDEGEHEKTRKKNNA